MADQKLRILIIGAHPDDADYKASGCAALWRAGGHEVKMISMTCGDAGHQSMKGKPLADRRRAEAAAAGAVIGAPYELLDFHDGELLPTLEARAVVIRLIRRFKPDLILTHRPNDYHPDHRYTSTLVQDALYMVTVPALCSDTPHLDRNPVLAYMSDHFTRPYAFDPAVAVDVGPVFDTMIEMLHRHTSQFYEWLPYNHGHAHEVPAGDADRKVWFKKRMRGIIAPLADKYRDLVNRTYGPTIGPRVELIEAFEAGEHGSPLDAAAIRKLFPFLP